MHDSANSANHAGMYRTSFKRLFLFLLNKIDETIDILITVIVSESDR